MPQQLAVIAADWSVPSTVVAFTTTTAGGVSEGACASFNLATHVDDNPEHVAENRRRLQAAIGSEVRLSWLRQTHSDIIVNADSYGGVVEGDAAVAGQPGRACVVMTADCLPVLLCNKQATRVAALHCGWRGLYNHLIQKVIANDFAGDCVIAWLGPAIGPQSYEVDESLCQRFAAADQRYAEAFSANRPGHYLMDLYAIARRQLVSAGVAVGDIYGGNFDTLTDARFFSHRRNARSGRMASVIYSKAN